MVTCALVTCQLDYYNALYLGLPMENVWKLQQVQNTALALLVVAAV